MKSVFVMACALIVMGCGGASRSETAARSEVAVPSAQVVASATVPPDGSANALIEPELRDGSGLCHKSGELAVGDVDDPALVRILYESAHFCLERIEQSQVTLAMVSAASLDEYRMRKKQLECWIEFRNNVAARDDQPPEVNTSYRFFWAPSIRGVPAYDLATHACDPE